MAVTPFLAYIFFEISLTPFQIFSALHSFSFCPAFVSPENFAAPNELVKTQKMFSSICKPNWNQKCLKLKIFLESRHHSTYILSENNITED